MEYGTHHYVDLSKLNAKWDEALPAVAGLGNCGSLSGNSLRTRSVGQTSPAFPWREESPDTKALQEAVNEVLPGMGYSRISADGVLGPATCGALRFIYQQTGDSWAIPPDTCQSFTAPSRPGSGTSRPTTSAAATTDVSAASMTGGPNWLLIGAGVGLLAIGAAVILKHKR